MACFKQFLDYGFPSTRPPSLSALYRYRSGDGSTTGDDHLPTLIRVEPFLEYEHPLRKYGIEVSQHFRSFPWMLHLLEKRGIVIDLNAGLRCWVVSMCGFVSLDGGTTYRSNADPGAVTPFCIIENSDTSRYSRPLSGLRNVIPLLIQGGVGHLSSERLVLLLLC